MKMFQQQESFPQWGSIQPSLGCQATVLLTGLLIAVSVRVLKSLESLARIYLNLKSQLVFQLLSLAIHTRGEGPLSVAKL